MANTLEAQVERRLNYPALIPLAEHFSSLDLSVHLEFDPRDPTEHLYLNPKNLVKLAKLAGINRLEVVNGDSQDRTYRLTYQDGQTTAQVYVDIDGIRRAIRLDKRWGQGKESTVPIR